jgi:hypothetical protein
MAREIANEVYVYKRYRFQNMGTSNRILRDYTNSNKKVVSNKL